MAPFLAAALLPRQCCVWRVACTRLLVAFHIIGVIDMDRMIYIGMSGAKEAMLAQSVNSNNLANISTTGFRADFAQFRSQPLFGPGLPSRAYGMAESPGVDFSPGGFEATGRSLDIAVEGEGWIAVQAHDGKEAYTRAGNMRVGPDGVMVTGSGYPVMTDGGALSIPPAESMSVGADGLVTIRPLGQSAAALAQVGRIKLVKPDFRSFVKGDDGLFRAKSGEPLPADGNLRLQSGVIEHSNVNVVEAMVNMITASRNYELHVKSMKAAEENDQASDTILRIS